MNKIKLFFAGLITASFMLVPAVAMAQTGTPPSVNEGLCAGASLQANASGTSCATTTAGTQSTVQNIVTKVINIFSWVVGIVSVLMIIFGGFKYITSGGDAGGVTGAKNTILYAIVGLVIVALAQVIVKFVIGTVSSAS